MQGVVGTGMSSWLQVIQSQKQKQQHCLNPTLCFTKSVMLREGALLLEERRSVKTCLT